MVILEGVGESGGRALLIACHVAQVEELCRIEACREVEVRMSVVELLGAHARMWQCGSLHNSCRMALMMVTVLPMPGFWEHKQTQGKAWCRKKEGGHMMMKGTLPGGGKMIGGTVCSYCRCCH